VGILGFSADGHLGGSAAPLPFVTEGMVGDAIDQAPYRPNFAILLYQALRRNGVPSELHIYERGKHGIGLANNHPWGSVTLDWLENR